MILIILLISISLQPADAGPPSDLCEPHETTSFSFTAITQLADSADDRPPRSSSHPSELWIPAAPIFSSFTDFEPQGYTLAASIDANYLVRCFDSIPTRGRFRILDITAIMTTPFSSSERTVIVSLGILIPGHDTVIREATAALRPDGQLPTQWIDVGDNLPVIHLGLRLLNPRVERISDRVYIQFTGNIQLSAPLSSDHDVRSLTTTARFSDVQRPGFEVDDGMSPTRPPRRSEIAAPNTMPSCSRRSRTFVLRLAW